MRIFILFSVFLSLLTLRASGPNPIKVIDTDMPGGSRAPSNNQNNTDDVDSDMNRRRSQRLKKPKKE